MGIAYDVEINYLEKGNIGGALEKPRQKAADLEKALTSLGGSVKDSFGNAFDMVGSFASGVATMAGAAVVAIGGIGWAVTKMSSELEDTNIALAATFAAHGAASSFSDGLGIAAQQISKMRKDAADLPGEFSDLANIMQSMAPSALEGGMSPDAMRQMAARTMAVAAVDRIPMAVAAREMAALLEGKAGAQNILGRKMMGLTGDKAKAFNHMSFDDRAKVLNKELNKTAYTDAIESYKHSFTGLFSTMKDNMKLFATTGGRPVFELMKAGLEKVNNWFDANKYEVLMWAEHVGTKIASAFEWGTKKIREWWPEMKEFTSVLWEDMKRVWTAIEPYVVKVGKLLKDAFEHPKETIDKMKELLELYVAAKIGGPMLGSLAGSAMTGMGGVEGIIAAIGGLPVALTAAFIGAGIILGKSAEASLAMSADDPEDKFHNKAKVALEAIHKVGAEASSDAALYWSATKANIGEASTGLSESFGLLSGAITTGLNYSLAGASEALANFTSLLGAKKMKEDANPVIDRDFDFGASIGLKAMNENFNKQTKPPEAPGHSTNIQKVEIIVQTNQDPQRIAQLAVGELTNLMKNPKGSKGVPSFLARR